MDCPLLKKKKKNYWRGYKDRHHKPEEAYALHLTLKQKVGQNLLFLLKIGGKCKRIESQCFSSQIKRVSSSFSFAFWYKDRFFFFYLLACAILIDRKWLYIEGYFSFCLFVLDFEIFSVKRLTCETNHKKKKSTQNCNKNKN